MGPASTISSPGSKTQEERVDSWMRVVVGALVVVASARFSVQAPGDRSPVLLHGDRIPCCGRCQRQALRAWEGVLKAAGGERTRKVLTTTMGTPPRLDEHNIYILKNKSYSLSI